MAALIPDEKWLALLVKIFLVYHPELVAPPNGEISTGTRAATERIMKLYKTVLLNDLILILTCIYQALGTRIKKTNLAHQASLKIWA